MHIFCFSWAYFLRKYNLTLYLNNPLSLFLFCTYLRIYPRWAFPPIFSFLIYGKSQWKKSFLPLLLLLIFSKWNRFMIFFVLPSLQTHFILLVFKWDFLPLSFILHLHTHLHFAYQRFFLNIIIRNYEFEIFTLCFHFPSKLPSFDDISKCHHHYIYCSPSCICERNEAKRCF